MIRSTRATIVFVFLAPLITAASVVRSADAAEVGAGPWGTLRTTLIDARVKSPVPRAHVLLVASDRAFHLAGITGDNGSVILEAPVGGYRLVAFSAGYRAATTEIRIADRDTVQVTLTLGAPIAVTDSVWVHAHRAGPDASQVPVSLEGPELRRNLRDTVAATLSAQPGIAERTMGAAPARPVLRGLDNYRVLVLEDGAPVGDISATSADHAVTIEPLHAKRVDIVRGPAALMYGANASAGVVDVTHDYVPATRLDSWQSTATVNATSANSGRALQGRVDGPAGPFVLTVGGSARNADDIRTPVGTLINTGIETYNAAAGASVVREHGYAGAAASLYRSDYGIPGGFLGGHPNGVDVHIEREHIEGKAERHFEAGGAEQTELHGSYSRFYQEERETNDACGVAFGVVTYSLQSRTKVTLGGAGTATIGAYGEYRDFAQACFTFLPRTNEMTLAAFAYDDVRVAGTALRAALRYDARAIQPQERDVNAAGEIRDRDFDGLSWSLAASRELGSGWNLGVTVLRSFRAPATEELYSEGPHLAAYSYEVGNADLNAETGVSVELAVGWRQARGDVVARAFANDFDGYIYAADTGEFEIGQGSDGFLPLYQYRGNDVRFIGGEFETEWRWHERWTAGASLSYVQATLLDSNEPLPRIPPLSGRVDLACRLQEWWLSAAVRGATAQDRVGKFEEPTAGYALLDLAAEWTLLKSSFLHSITIRVDNLTDEEYYNHLSRVKSIMPETGRNVSILYRIGWL